MDKVLFGVASYDLALNGATVTNDFAAFMVVMGDATFEKIKEDVVAGCSEIKVERDDGTILAEYDGYTSLRSLEVIYDYHIDDTESTKQMQKYDEHNTPMYDEHGDPIYEDITVYTPVYGTVVKVNLYQPTLEATVADQGEQITEIQEVLVGM